MDTGLKDKVVLITGGARGIGRAIADAFMDEGAKVVVTDRDVASGEAAAAELGRRGTARFLPLDVTDRNAVKATFAEAERAVGPIDVLVNNAGIVSLVPLEEMTGEEWDRIQAVNVKGILFCMQAVVPGMKARRGGRIVNVCSQTSKMAGAMNYAHYTASKAAAWNLTMSAARRYASIPINVNGVAPGSVVETEFSRDFNLPMDRATVQQGIPIGRRASPKEIAPTVVFLASTGAAYITGELIDVNGGALMD
jgi:3-oxoacyl-[acyl-carrier protein] reductase